MTFNEHIAAAIALADSARGESTTVARSLDETLTDAEKAEHNAAARDLSLTITHLEDANTRYNSARYHQNGTWKRADPDKTYSTN